jgi:hypothetical protein
MMLVRANKLSTVFVLLSVLIAAGTSCEDFLDQKPTDGLVRSEYWNNKEEVLSTLAGAYKKLAAVHKTMFIHGEVRGDMIDAGGNLPNVERKLMEGNIQSDNNFAKWGDFYVVINLCNHVIEISPSVQEVDQTFSDFLLQQYISEAIFLRSLCYFYLVRIWNDVPFVLEPSETDNADFFPPLTSADTVLSTIKTDLIGISNKILEVFPTIEESKSRANAGAVYALLADISLWQFDYADCIKYVEEVENSGEYFLLPSTEWFDIFQPGFSLEGIFEIYFNSSINQENDFYKVTIDRNYYLASEYAQEVLNVETLGAAEQIRGYGSISLINKIWKYGGQYPDQKTERPAETRASANFIVYRLADLYLMKAEALSQTGDFNGAEEYLNLIRERANVDPINLSGDVQGAEETILEERAKELAFEGKRWFDLLRMGRRNDYANADKLVEILIQDVPSTQKLVQKAKLSNPLGWFMPIHRTEIERNREINQNPYYYVEN